MTDKTRAIFSDRGRLRDKLRIYLQTPEKVELYAQAAEAMFEKGKGEKIAFVATWSWWAFFFCPWFYAYRKQYSVAIMVFILVLIPLVGFVTVIAACISAKYYIVKDFAEKLDLDDDEKLKTGTNMGGVIAFIVLGAFIIGFLRLAAQ